MRACRPAQCLAGNNIMSRDFTSSVTPWQLLLEEKPIVAFAPGEKVAQRAGWGRILPLAHIKFRESAAWGHAALRSASPRMISNRKISPHQSLRDSFSSRRSRLTAHRLRFMGWHGEAVTDGLNRCYEDINPSLVGRCAVKIAAEFYRFFIKFDGLI